jgi:imidazolonepropionase-like amidohydrolase/Tol biopolymer transport system component
MRRTLIALLATTLALPAVAQTPPSNPPAAKRADPVSPEKAEQEPRPAEQEIQKRDTQRRDAPAPQRQAAPLPAAATPPASAPAKDDKPKWDVNAPPGPAHDVQIDTTTGTWMSLDVSPDGREVVFDLLGDLYVIPIGGGEARALTTGVAWDMQPRFSPNGRWIAFTSDRGGGDNIWMMNRDGSGLKQVTKETFRLLNQPVWTPDSEYIIARKHFTKTRSLGAGEMWIYHRSGGEGVQLTKKRTDQKDTNEPAVSPDGRYVYFSDDSTPGDVFEYSKDPNGQIYVIRRLDREKGDVEAFVTGPGGSIRPTPSPDGKSLAFIRRVRYKSVLYVMDLESGREVPIYDGLDRDMQETWAIHGVYPNMAWTPDGKSIVVWAGGKIRRVDVAARQAADIPFHVRSTRRVEQAVRFPVKVAPEQFEVKMLRWPTVSPRGDKVVFQALGRLWVRDMAGGQPRRLTRQNDHFEFYPSWSRDGKSVVYTTWSDKDFGSIRVVPAAGGEGRVVSAKPGHYVEPAFSPDGSKIVYRATSDGYLTPATWGRNPGIYVVPAAGGAPILVSDKGVAPQWGARNDRVFFTTFEEENKRALRSVEIDGGEERQHLTSAFATEFAISPDEKWIAWQERYNAYVMPFVRTGKAVEIAPDAKSLPVTRVSRDAGDYLSWSGDSKRLWWSLGPQLYSRDLNQAFAFVDGAPATLPEPPQTGINISFSQPYAAPSGRVAFTGAKIVTMRGDEVIENGTIVVRGNRIEQVGPASSVAIPADAKRVDVSGKTIIPGLIDSHWHGSMGSDEIIPQRSWVDFASLAFGVTTLHDPSNDTSEIFAHSELAKAGSVLAPRIFSTGTILYGATTPFTVKVEGLDDAKSALRRLQAVGAFSVKSYNQPRREQRQQIIEAARQVGMMVVPEGGSLFEHNMTMVVDGHTSVEHSIPVANVYDDVLQLWGGSDTAYTPTLIVAYGGAFGENYWYEKTNVWEDQRLSRFVPRRILDSRSRRREMIPDEENNWRNIARSAKKLVDRGVKVQTGAHGQREDLGLHWEMWMMGEGGMTPLEVIRAATLNGASFLGLDGDIGSLEPGKLADMVVLDADPLQNLRNTTSIRYTVLNGRIYDAMTMSEVGGPAQAPFWHQEDGGEAFSPNVTTLYSHGED